MLEEILEIFTNDWFSVLENLGIVLGITVPIIVLVLQILKNRRKKPFLDSALNQKEYLTSKGYIPLRYSFDLPKKNDNNEFLYEEVTSDKTLESYLLKRNWFNYSFRIKQGRILLLGQVGTGKSRTLVSIYSKLSNSLRSSKNLKVSPKVILISMLRWDELYSWKNIPILNELINSTYRRSEDCVLLLDGYDEFVERHKVDNPSKLLNEIYDYFSDFRSVIISSRITNKIFDLIKEGNITNEIKPIFLTPLNEKEIIKYIKNKYGLNTLGISIDTKKVKNILEVLNSNNKNLLNKISRRPLLLTYIEDITQVKYRISSESLRGIIKNPYFKISTTLTTKDFFSLKEFKNSLLSEINYQPSSVIRHQLQRNITKIIDHAGSSNTISNYSDIYDRILDMHHLRELKKEKLSKSDKQKLLSLIDYFLFKVSNYMYNNLTYEIPNNKLENMWIDYLAHNDGSNLQNQINISNRSFLKAITPRTQGFIHKSFQDYFVAKYYIHFYNREISIDNYFNLKKSDNLYQQLIAFSESFKYKNDIQLTSFPAKIIEIGKLKNSESLVLNFTKKLSKNLHTNTKVKIGRDTDFVEKFQLYLWINIIMESPISKLRNLNSKFIKRFALLNIDIVTQNYLFNKPLPTTVFENCNTIHLCSILPYLHEQFIVLYEHLGTDEVLIHKDNHGMIPLSHTCSSFPNYSNLLTDKCNLITFLMKQEIDKDLMVLHKDNYNKTPLFRSISTPSLFSHLLSFYDSDYISKLFRSQELWQAYENVLFAILAMERFSIDRKVELIEIIAKMDNKILASVNNSGRTPLEHYLLFYSLLDVDDSNHSKFVIRMVFFEKGINDENTRIVLERNGDQKIIDTYMNAYIGSIEDIFVENFYTEQELKRQ